LRDGTAVDLAPEEDVMIHVTEGAAVEIKSVLTSSQAPQDQGLKLSPNDKGSVVMTVDKARDGDDVVRDEDRTLLIVDSAIARRPDGVVFDLAHEDEKKAGDGMRFVLRSPAA
jgi:Fe-S cluster assembly iron-binding protein IscA